MFFRWRYVKPKNFVVSIALNRLCQAKERKPRLKIEGTRSEGKPRYNCCFVFLLQLIYMTFTVSIVKHFPVDSIKFEFGYNVRLNFNIFLWKEVFETLEIWTKYQILEQISPIVSLFETFASNRPFICNRHQILSLLVNTCHFLEILQTFFYTTFIGKLVLILCSFIFKIGSFFTIFLWVITEKTCR